MAEQGTRKKKGNIVVWVLLGLLVLALGGFGIGGFGNSAQSVARVGDREVSVSDYGNALQQEIGRLSQQTGQPFSMAQMQALGLDRQVLQRLLSGAALDNETDALGISVGDAEVATRVRAVPAFQSAAGFDRTVYADLLRRQGSSPQRFEASVRDEAAREILQAAIIGGTEPPAGYAETLATWLGETRDITVAEVRSAQLDAGAVAPTEEDLAAFHEENARLFEVPERRVITYAWASPEALAAETEVEETQIATLYEARADLYRIPARVLAERLAFADAAAAQAAVDAIAAEETTFETLVEERGLTLEDVDQGEIAAGDVDDAVAEALFALEDPGLVGPVETDLGPALYRVNAILDARETPLEDVRDELQREAAMDAATRRIDAAREGIDDLLAAGATLEEVADETLMELGTVEWDPSVSEGIAGYDGFRIAAQTVTEDDFPELVSFADGGLAAIRLDRIDPAALPPLDEVRTQVEAAWQSDSLRDRLAARAEALAERLRAGEEFDALGLAPDIVTGIERDGGIADTPGDLVERVFAAAEGEVIAEAGDEQRAYLIRVDAVTPPDLASDETASLMEAISATARREIAGDLFDSYAAAARDAAGFEIDAGATRAVQAQYGAHR